MNLVFISYRRADCPDSVARLSEKLKACLRNREVFYDHTSIELGAEFPQLLRDKVAEADVVLVCIGPKWLELLKARKDEPIDFVREEVRLALAGGKDVIPILIGGNLSMPTAAELADFPELAKLPTLNAQTVRPDPNFDPDCNKLLAHLERTGPTEIIGTILGGKYKVLRHVGEGGMGDVYQAEQSKPERRDVAIKLIKAGMDSKEILKRFDSERAALAVMDHPNICKVLDGGHTPSGRPYFAMEFVRGVPITKFCDQHKYTPQQRVELFLTVCQAVQHAHQKGIIHRDLKPANVLVELKDNKHVVKVIDFGLAKALGQKLSELSFAGTEFGKWVGTLEYSSPEQADGRSDIDTLTDVYSLGAMLYELLAGSPPFTREELLKSGEAEMLRMIKEDVPSKASTKLSSSANLPSIAANRHLEPARLTKNIRGDLDWILLKSLDKERTKRYATPTALADDLERHLKNEPISAGRPTVGQRLKKFVRRNKGQVLAATLVIVALIAGVIGTSIGLVKAEKERADAVTARVLAEKAQKDRVLAQANTLLTADYASLTIILKNLEPYRKEVTPFLQELHKRRDLSEKERIRVSLALLPDNPDLVAELSERLLKAEPQELLVIRKALLAHRGKLTDDLWRLVENRDSPKDQRLRAACVLAAYDPSSARWTGVLPSITATLVAQPPVFLADWMEALRPIRLALLEPLAHQFRHAGEQQERYLAANVLADYAADRFDILTDLIQDADSHQYAVFLPVLKVHRDGAIVQLKKELDQILLPDWRDSPGDPSWVTPNPTVVAKLQGAQGMLEERFAFAQSLALGDLPKMVDALGRAGYRPIRLRPYTVGKAVLVAVVWQRDGRDWQIAYGNTVEELHKQDTNWRARGYVPVDAAGYVLNFETVTPLAQYTVIWVKSATEREDVRLYLGLSSSKYNTATNSLNKYFYPVALHEMAMPGGDYLYSAVFRRSGEYVAWENYFWDHEPGYEKRLTPSNLQVDVCLAPALTPQGKYEAYAKWKASFKANSGLGENKILIDIVRPLMSGIEKFDRNEDKQAIADFTTYIEKFPFMGFLGWDFRAMAHARLGHADEAKKDLTLARANFRQIEIVSNVESMRPIHLCADAVVSVYLGEDEASLKRLDTLVEEQARNAEVLFQAARTYAFAAGFVGREPTVATPDKLGDVPKPVLPAVGTTLGPAPKGKAKRYADRAVALLGQALDNGFANDGDALQIDSNLDSIRDYPPFRNLLDSAHLDVHYTALWRTGTSEQEGKEVHGLTPDAHLRACRLLAAQGYRPTAVAVFCSAKGSEPITASVWHRPVVSEAAKDALARRQVNAVLALVQLGDPTALWPRLAQSPDPRLRTYLIHRLGASVVESQPLFDHLMDARTKVSTRRALLLSLGEYPEKNLSTGLRDRMVPHLLQIYRNDPDPGVHSASEWLLRRWGQNEEIGRVHRELISKAPSGIQRWYVNGKGYTFAMIPGPVELQTGSPSSEPYRRAGEALHPVRIDRSFAIATKDTTIDQFLNFRRDHSYDKRNNSDQEGPIVEVSWYEAAQYCRWLSEQEGIPEAEMCFPPMSQIKPGMTLPPNYLSRTGYRLPTEAEWEYACRAEAVTPRSYGHDEKLLGFYAWHKDNSDDHAWPVGSLKPNDLGLFDMHGNIRMWCMDPFADYALLPRGRVVLDLPTSESAANRVIRGNAWSHDALTIRCAYRQSAKPSDQFTNVGIRVARTLPK